MTMADQIAVMNAGHVEQLGTPSELYERPRTPFVAGFLGVSNLLHGTAAGDSSVRLDAGGEVRVGDLRGRSGRVAVGIRPEKIRFGRHEINVLEGVVEERSYVGVATEYIVATPAGALTVYVQNGEPGATPAEVGSRLALSWSPEASFVVDTTQEVNQ